MFSMDLTFSNILNQWWFDVICLWAILVEQTAHSGRLVRTQGHPTPPDLQHSVEPVVGCLEKVYTLWGRGLKKNPSPSLSITLPTKKYQKSVRSGPSHQFGLLLGPRRSGVSVFLTKKVCFLVDRVGRHVLGRLGRTRTVFTCRVDAWESKTFLYGVSMWAEINFVGPNRLVFLGLLASRI